MDRREFLATTGTGAALLSLSTSAAAQTGPAGPGPTAGRAVLDITDFGIVAGNEDRLAVSNSAAADRLLAHLLANNPTPGLPGTAAIRVTAPAGHFRFARPWVVKCALWLEGQSNSHRWGYATHFDFDTGGFQFHGPSTNAGGLEARPGTTASGWRLENLYCSSRAATGTGHHGLHAVVRGDVVRCTFEEFPGDGIRIESQTGFGARNNNANGTRILFCQCGGNGGSGIHLLNGDSNCVITQACDLAANGEFGLFDNAFLSNHHIGHHVEGNGLGLVYEGHKIGPVGSCCTMLIPAWQAGAAYAVINPDGNYRRSAGRLYLLLRAGAGKTANAPAHQKPAGAEEADGYVWSFQGTATHRRYHTTIDRLAAASATVPGTDPSVWVPFEFSNGVSKGIPLWAPGMTWKNGGSYCGNSQAAQTVWEACYGEGGQPPAQLRSPHVWIGGQGGVSRWSAGVEMRNQFGALSNPGGFLAEKPFYNGQNCTATFGTVLGSGVWMTLGHETRFPTRFFGTVDLDISFTLLNTATFMSFTGAKTAFTGGRSSGQPGVVHVPQLFVGSGSNARNIDYGSGPPAAGSHAAGEIVYNVAPAPGGKIGWVCTAAGTPGTWKAFGEIDP